MIAGLMAGDKSELTDNMLINESTFGVPSALAMYLGAKGFLYSYKMYDRLLNMGE